MMGVRRSIDLSWGRVSYLEWQPQNSSPVATVVLLHGGGLDSASLSWGEVGRTLADSGYHVIAPDHPGYGQSPPAPWTASQERLVAYVGEFVDALGLERYTIGGLSLGGGLTIGHVLERPQRVISALLLGSYGLMDRQFAGVLALPTQVLLWGMLRVGLLSAITRAYAKDRKQLTRSLRSIIRNPSQRTPELIDEIMAEAGRGTALATFEQWQREQFGWNRLKTNYTARLTTFPRPALIIHGERDSGVPIARARLAAQQIPDARLVVVPDAGHWVQRDRPDVVIPAIVEFLGHQP